MSMGPINLPEPKQPWGWLVVAMLLAFAGGVAAGPTLTDKASELIDRVSALFTPRASQPAEKHKPAAPSVVALPTPAAPAAKAVAKPEPERAAEAAAPREPPAAAPAPVQAKVAAAEPPAGRAQHKKGGGRNRAAKEPASASAKAAAAEFEESAAPAKSEPAPKPAPSKPAPSKSSGSIDDLIANAVAEDSSKKKKGGSKDIDALLKDVQQSRPEPAARREEPAAAATTLSASDISRAMAGVKTRSNECAQRLGQAGIAALKINVGKSGKVSDARVTGKLANTPLGQCIEKAARAASFPPSAGLRFDYSIDAH